MTSVINHKASIVLHSGAQICGPVIHLVHLARSYSTDTFILFICSLVDRLISVAVSLGPSTRKAAVVHFPSRHLERIMARFCWQIRRGPLTKHMARGMSGVVVAAGHKDDYCSLLATKRALLI